MVKHFNNKVFKRKKYNPIYRQLDAMDCGPVCLRMVAEYYGRSIQLEFLRRRSEFGKSGTWMLGLSDTAESIGFRTIGAKLSFEQLIEQAPLPTILHWDQYHFVVLTPGSTSKKPIIADPARGLVQLKKREFIYRWLSSKEDGEEKGIALLLEKTPNFDNNSILEGHPTENKIGWAYLLSFFKNSRLYLLQIIMG